MATSLNTLRLHVKNARYTEEPLDDMEIRPLIDGVDVIEAAYEDLEDSVQCGDPRVWLVPGGPLAAGDEPRTLDFAEKWCGCHDGQMLTVRRDGGTVVWHWRPGEGGDPVLPEYRFDAAAYDAELDRASRDFGWEIPADTVARLLREALRARIDWLARWSCEVYDVWAPSESGVLVVFERNEQDSDGGWRQAEEFAVKLPVTDEGPVVQAALLADRLLAGDPRTAEEAHLSGILDLLQEGRRRFTGPPPWAL
ncbi:hypothetical protein ACWCQL_09685 [Streptomyces sp. NPDC002073]